MSKPVLSIFVTVVVLVGAVGGYRYFTQTHITQVEVQPAPQQAPANQAPASPTPRPVPKHGDFDKRFQPTPPPPNGGRFN